MPNYTAAQKREALGLAIKVMDQIITILSVLRIRGTFMYDESIAILESIKAELPDER